MDGFNLIPQEDQQNVVKSDVTSLTLNQDIISKKSDIANNNEVNKTKGNATVGQSYFIIIAILLLIGSIGYSIFLFAQRQVIISSIQSVSMELKTLESKINKTKLEDLKTTDQKLKIILERLSKHILVTDIFSLVNQNIRSTAQVTDYKIDTADNELSMSFTAITPTFKDFAEQVDKFIQIKKEQRIKGFSVSGLSYEQDTKRVRFTIKLILDKSKFSAASGLISKNK